MQLIFINLKFIDWLLAVFGKSGDYSKAKLQFYCCTAFSYTIILLILLFKGLGPVDHFLLNISAFILNADRFI